jgi:hypothetical protein
MELNELLLTRSEVPIEYNANNLSYYNVIVPMHHEVCDYYPENKINTGYCAIEAAGCTIKEIDESIAFEINRLKGIDEAIIRVYEQAPDLGIDGHRMEVLRSLNLIREFEEDGEIKKEYANGRVQDALHAVSRTPYLIMKLINGEVKPEEHIQGFESRKNHWIRVAHKYKLLERVDNSGNELEPNLYFLRIGINGVDTCLSDIHFSRAEDFNLTTEKFKKYCPRRSRLKGYTPHNVESLLEGAVLKNWAINYNNLLLKDLHEKGYSKSIL